MCVVVLGALMNWRCVWAYFLNPDEPTMCMGVTFRAWMDGRNLWSRDEPTEPTGIICGAVMGRRCVWASFFEL